MKQHKFFIRMEDPSGYLCVKGKRVLVGIPALDERFQFFVHVMWKACRDGRFRPYRKQWALSEVASGRAGVQSLWDRPIGSAVEAVTAFQRAIEGAVLMGTTLEAIVARIGGVDKVPVVGEGVEVGEFVGLEEGGKDAYR